MPTYQYACTACADRLEVVQAFVDEPLTQCPSCGGRLRKVFSPVGVVFKGSGFYKTDSRAAAKKGSGAATSTAAETTTETGSDRKSPSDAGDTSAPAAAKPAEPASTKSSPKTDSATPSTAGKAPARSG